MWNRAEESYRSRNERKIEVEDFESYKVTTRRNPTTRSEAEPESEEEEEEEEGETEQEQLLPVRYRQSSLDEVSDPEVWQQIHH